MLMGNLGGHDLPSLLEAFEAASRHDRPVCFIAYTIKGHGLPLAGHKDNHAGLMTPSQMEVFRAAMNVRPGHEWDKWEGASTEAATLDRFVAAAPFFAQGQRRLTAPVVPVPDTLEYPTPGGKPLSTQMGFGQILNDIAREDTELAAAHRDDLARRHRFHEPRGAGSTAAGSSPGKAWPTPSRPSAFPRPSPGSSGLRASIWNSASPRSNLFIMLSALGLSHTINGERLLPIGTVYDPFIYRAADQMNYACYQDARFLLVATPSGITLAPEGGAHQSIGTPLIGLAQDGLCAFEPAFVDELAVMLRFAFDYMQRNGDGDPDETTWLRDQTGGSVYLRLSTRPLEQPLAPDDADLTRDIVNGGYWLRPPGPNASVVIAYQGVVAPEAITATGLLAEDRRDVGLLAITSADRLNAGDTRRPSAPASAAMAPRQSHVERLLAPLSRDCGIVTVIDGHPATLAWLGGVHGPQGQGAGRRAFRPDRHDRRPLSPPRHRRQCDRPCRAGGQHRASRSAISRRWRNSPGTRLTGASALERAGQQFRS